MLMSWVGDAPTTVGDPTRSRSRRPASWLVARRGIAVLARLLEPLLGERVATDRAVQPGCFRARRRDPGVACPLVQRERTGWIARGAAPGAVQLGELEARGVVAAGARALEQRERLRRIAGHARAAIVQRAQPRAAEHRLGAARALVVPGGVARLAELFLEHAQADARGVLAEQAGRAVHRERAIGV